MTDDDTPDTPPEAPAATLQLRLYVAVPARPADPGRVYEDVRVDVDAWRRGLVSRDHVATLALDAVLRAAAGDERWDTDRRVHELLWALQKMPAQWAPGAAGYGHVAADLDIACCAPRPGRNAWDVCSLPAGHADRHADNLTGRTW